MKYIIILILFCSCSSKMMINGVEIKHKNQLPKREIPTLIAAFFIGYSIIPIIKP